MNGYEYEHACARQLKKFGYNRIEVTSGSGDQGIDIIACRGGKKYGFQCKYYDSPVGNFAVQQAYSGASYYDCDQAVVITNNRFTPAALSLAESTGVMLWENFDPATGLSGLILTFQYGSPLQIGLSILHILYWIVMTGFMAFCLAVIAGVLSPGGSPGGTSASTLWIISAAVYLLSFCLCVAGAIVRSLSLNSAAVLCMAALFVADYVISYVSSEPAPLELMVISGIFAVLELIEAVIVAKPED